MSVDEPIPEKIPPRVKMPSIIPVLAQETPVTPPEFSQAVVVPRHAAVRLKILVALLIVLVVAGWLYWLGSRQPI